VQKALAESIRKHIVRPFEALGWEVDLYLTAFPCFQTYCPNPKLCFNESGATAHYMRDLGKWLNASALDVFEPTLETVGTRFGEQGLHDSKQGRYAEGVLRMVQTSPNKYDYVICSRIDQGFRDDITAFLRWERQDTIAPFFAQPVRLHENVLAFPGCLLDTVVGVLHAGCVERSAAFDFGTCCFKEIRQVMKLRDTTHEGVNTFDFDGEQEQTYFVNNSVVIPMDLDDDIKRRYLSQGNGGDVGSSPRFWTQTMQGRAPGFGGEEQRDKLDAGLREVEFKPRDGDTARCSHRGSCTCPGTCARFWRWTTELQRVSLVSLAERGGGCHRGGECPWCHRGSEASARGSWVGGRRGSGGECPWCQVRRRRGARV
jgi:hypothetical protein